MTANDRDAAHEDGFAHDEERFFSEAESHDAKPEPAEERPFSSLTPTVLDTDEPFPLLNRLEQQSRPHDPALEARRKRLRKAVLGTLCASAALLLLGVARRPLRDIHPHSSSVPARAAAAAVASPHAPEPLSESPPIAQPVASASPTTPIAENTARESAHALLLSARSLLQAGRIRAGVEVARQALAANSNDAEPYILLAAGLQDLGDWSGAQRVFAACKARARSGSQAECSYFSSQKR